LHTADDSEKYLTKIPDLDDILASHELIKPFIHRTPVLTSGLIDEEVGANVFFKCENFQKIGAFKMRGAMNTALRLRPEEVQRGLATHSSGNHAQAVALTARLLGTKAYIVMPDSSPKTKVEATKGYGANIFFCENTLAAREAGLAAVIRQVNATFIHPYDDYNVIAGQATAAKELHEDIPDLEAIIAPVGGGGLMSGTALITHYLRPNVKIYGAEPEQVDDAYRSFKSGVYQTNKTIETIADGLRTNLSAKTFEIIRLYLDDIFTVSESEIIAALRLINERMKIIIEPSSAVPLAVILRNKPIFKGKKIGLILSGGNIDFTPPRG